MKTYLLFNELWGVVALSILKMMLKAPVGAFCIIFIMQYELWQLKVDLNTFYYMSRVHVTIITFKIKRIKDNSTLYYQ